MVHNRFRRLVLLFRCLIILSVLFLISCSEKGDPIPPKPAVDLSGVWAGSWTGYDPVIGPVSGTWESDLSQPGYRVRATFRLDGDVDCPDGDLVGAVGPNNIVSGTVTRPPCYQNEWVLTGSACPNGPPPAPGHSRAPEHRGSSPACRSRNPADRAFRM